MASSLFKTAQTLIKALNTKGYKLTFSQKEFMGTEGQPHKYYCIQRAVWNQERGKYNHIDVYSSTSQVRIVLFLRDMWYDYNGWELPTDQEQWNKIREENKSRWVVQDTVFTE